MSRSTRMRSTICSPRSTATCESSSRAATCFHSFSGVRPLYDDNAANPSAVTRDYVFDVDGERRRCSRSSAARSRPIASLPSMRCRNCGRSFPRWGATGPPTPRFPAATWRGRTSARSLASSAVAIPGCRKTLALHYARLYGTLSQQVLDGARNMADLGQYFGGNCYAAEIDYLRRSEWAQTAEDILFRRTKCGLHMSQSQRDAVAALC